MCVVTRLFDAILLRREGLSRNGLIRFFVPDAKSDIDAAARAPDMPALIQQKQKEGEAHVAKYGTKTSYGPLFGLAYSSPSRRSTSTDLIATLHSCDRAFLERESCFWGMSPLFFLRTPRARRDAQGMLCRAVHVPAERGCYGPSSCMSRLGFYRM